MGAPGDLRDCTLLVGTPGDLRGCTLLVVTPGDLRDCTLLVGISGDLRGCTLLVGTPGDLRDCILLVGTPVCVMIASEYLRFMYIPLALVITMYLDYYAATCIPYLLLSKL